MSARHPWLARVVVVGAIVGLLGVQLSVDVEAANAGCTVERIDGQAVLTWADDGGRHIVRRDGRWLATPGSDTDSFIDDSPVDGAAYLIRTRTSDGGVLDRDCREPAQPTARNYVVHVSLDGLRSDHVTPELMPNLSELVIGGASTMNARTDPSITKTLPNHTSQFTGQFVWGPTGHRITVNEDPGGTVHDYAGMYVSSVFDVVHDHGGRTVVYVGKSKFFLHERSWGLDFGAPDLVGEDNGTNKIDVFVKEDPTIAAEPFVDDLIAGEGDTYGFFHIRTPDSAGHTHNWGSEEYAEGVTEADTILGDLLDRLDIAGVLDTTTVIVTADHGGPLGGNNHEKQDLVDNYTVPFVVFGPDVAAGADLYELNAGVRTDPGTSRPNKQGPQPIRGHDVANLSLDLLELPPIPGSVVNADQDLRVN